jgi:hypothetical protein
MTTTRNIPFRSIVLGATLTCMGGAAAFAAPNPNTYANGTYLVVHLDSAESDYLTITFDGAGNYSGTDVSNIGGTVSSHSLSGTYIMAADGTFTVDSGTNLISGAISADGNVVVITHVSSGSTPDVDIGVKLGLVAKFNVASGILALAANTTGTGNSAVGDLALTGNSSGANNTAFGYQALYANTTGKGNAAQGVNALYNNTSGIRNLGIGSNALFGNTIGSYNIALGFDAGYNVTTGSNNIEIGAMGTASDSNTIQIGVQGTQTSTTIAGIYGTPVTGSAVYVTSTGQLGVQASSERYKTDIATMPELSGKLAQLRPVTFHYRTDPKGVQQYGLIAEEVDKVYPELVIRDDSGKIQGVHYEELAPMLLSEVQQQQGELRTQRSEIRTQQAMIQSQAAKINNLTRQVAELNDLKQEMRAALRRLQSKEALVAQR